MLFVDVQFLDMLNFLGRAISVDFFLKAYKTWKTKRFFPYEKFNDPEKLNNTQVRPYETFFSKLRNENPLEDDLKYFQILIDGSFTSEEALSKLKMKKPPAVGQKNYQYLTSVWQRENFLYLQMLFTLV